MGVVQNNFSEMYDLEYVFLPFDRTSRIFLATDVNLIFLFITGNTGRKIFLPIPLFPQCWCHEGGLFAVQGAISLSGLVGVIM